MRPARKNGAAASSAPAAAPVAVAADAVALPLLSPEIAGLLYAALAGRYLDKRELREWVRELGRTLR